jgi:hypothetical protein
MGREKFKEGLAALGYAVEFRDQDKILFTFVIPEGRFANQSIKVGIQVPPDFDVVPPGGIHICPRLIPINPEAKDHTKAVASPFGDEWEYLSRPFTEWARKRTVKHYMKWVSYLLNAL